MKRSKEFALFFVILVFLVSIAVVSTGCSKKQVVKEEAAGTPLVVEKKAQIQVTEQPRVIPAPVTPPGPMAPKKEMPASSEAKPVPFDLSGKRIQFAFDDYSLSVKAKERLDEIGSWMKKTPGVKIQIQGNTCDIGTNEYNLALGDQRARSARKYLETLGLEHARLSTISYGEERPMVPNSDEKNRSLNRRDDFVLEK